MEPGKANLTKTKTILSVARYEPEGTKRQREMIEVFLTLKREHPGIMDDWKFVLVGGSPSKSPYLTGLENMIGQNPGYNVQLKTNVPVEQLKSLYKESTLFWHLCGLNHRDPSEIEHFGMTTVEAMQNRVVPLVYDGGGQREIVDHGENGFRVRSKAELFHYTLKLLQNETLIRTLARNAQKKAMDFSRVKFEERIRAFFDGLARSYGSPENFCMNEI